MRRIIILLVLSIVCISVFLGYQGWYFSQPVLRLTACDVGQGDAIHIRTPSGYDVLIDGGPNAKVLNCLAKSLPLWDRSLDVVLLTHPHRDHFRGLIDVLDRYAVKTVIVEDLDNPELAYQEFVQKIKEEQAQVVIGEKGKQVTFPDSAVLSILGPDSTFLARENPEKMLNNKNPPSLIVYLQYKSIDVLFPGDSDAEDFDVFVPKPLKPEILFAPHHGSKNGVDMPVLARLSPQYVIISAGQNNSYGHPHAEVLKLLAKLHIPFYSTDQHGMVQIETDGEAYQLKAEHEALPR